MKQVLFWSKYSNNCKKLLTLMNEHNFNIENVCVDNKDIRNRILNDKRINLSKVPTILTLHDTGVIEKYEGEKAFALFHEAFSRMKKKQETIILENKIASKKTIQTETSPMDNPSIQNETPSQKNTAKGLTSLADLTGEDLFAEDRESRVNNTNLPIKTSSKISTIAADIAKSREVMDSTIPKPTKNNIVPK